MKKHLKKIYKNLQILKKRTKKNSLLKSNIKIITQLIKKHKDFVPNKVIESIELKMILMMKILHLKNNSKNLLLLIEAFEILLHYKETRIMDLPELIYPGVDDDEESGKDTTSEKIESKKININLVQNLEDELNKKIYSQPKAIAEIVNRIKINVSGLGESHKPIGSFLCNGPTGVGKTELAIQLSKALDLEYVRIDMSEYAQEHTAINLIGAPASYIGHKEGGVFSRVIPQDKPVLLLLDEIEKAHPAVMKYFLQILDNAEITDNHGVKINFENTIIIMTSNLGETKESVVGFTQNQSESTMDKAVSEYFAPEFINRLDAIIKFNALGQDIALNIVDKFLNEVGEKLSHKDVRFNISYAAKKRLSELGFSKKMGARAMKRVIAKEIIEPISSQIVDATIKEGDTLHIELKENKFSF